MQTGGERLAHLSKLTDRLPTGQLEFDKQDKKYDSSHSHIASRMQKIMHKRTSNLPIESLSYLRSLSGFLARSEIHLVKK